MRASGAPYTIVRPGWLDQAAAGEDALVLRQGDLMEAGVSRQQVAETSVRSLLTDTAIGKTFELFATPGPATQDSVDDPANLPLSSEPDSVKTDISYLTNTTSR